ncbi:hypothetical protein BGZ92_006806 [Podila epicladia]|nr:hypothetical protein BGZ92_006806 [Podila epicladia]
MPSNDNFNQTVRFELWCTNSENPILPKACFKSSSFVIFPIVAGLPTLITNLPGVTTPHSPSLPSPEPSSLVDDGSASSFMSSTGALIGLIGLSFVIAAVFGWYFWRYCREKRRARRESHCYAQLRQKGLSPAPWNLHTNRNRTPPPPGLIISSPSPSNTARLTAAPSVGLSRHTTRRNLGPPRLGEMLFERTFENSLALHSPPPLMPLLPPPPLLSLPLPPPPPPIRPRRPSVVPSLPAWSQRSESIVYLDTQRSDLVAYLGPDTDDNTASETSSFYSEVRQLVPDTEEYYSSTSSSMTSSSSSGSSLDLDAFLLQLSQTPPVPTRSNESHLVVLRSDLDKETERKQWQNLPYGYF